MILLTEKTLLEIAGHEAIIFEAYKDSRGIWTWGPGITSASGHLVERYIDNPQTLERCLAVYEWLLRTKYLPEVLKAFDGHPLTEAQLAAALSFHWNTGGIGRADWVALWKAGKTSEARQAILRWCHPPEILGRRKLERDLFFDGRWSNDGTVLNYAVNKPSHTPQWRSAKHLDIRPALREVLHETA